MRHAAPRHSEVAGLPGLLDAVPLFASIPLPLRPAPHPAPPAVPRLPYGRDAEADHRDAQGAGQAGEWGGCWGTSQIGPAFSYCPAFSGVRSRHHGCTWPSAVPHSAASAARVCRRRRMLTPPPLAATRPHPAHWATPEGPEDAATQRPLLPAAALPGLW